MRKFLYPLDELIDLRKHARESKDFKLADELRDYLDTHLIFIFDAAWGQEIYYLTEKYFRFKDKFEHTKVMTNRKFVEYKIQQDIRDEKLLNAWIYTTKQSV